MSYLWEKYNLARWYPKVINGNRKLCRRQSPYVQHYFRPEIKRIIIIIFFTFEFEFFFFLLLLTIEEFVSVREEGNFELCWICRRWANNLVEIAFQKKSNFYFHTWMKYKRNCNFDVFIFYPCSRFRIPESNEHLVPLRFHELFSLNIFRFFILFRITDQ